MAFIADAFDEKKIQDGRWCEYEGSKFLIARSDNDRYRKAISELLREAKKEEMDASEIGNRERLLHGTYLLVDWEGVIKADGSSLKYTPEAASKAMRFDRDFHDWVLRQSSDNAQYRHDDILETEKKQ